MQITNEAYSNTIDELLKHSKYNYLQNKNAELIERIKDFVIDTISRILSKLTLNIDRSGSPELLSKVFMGLGIAITIICIGVIIYFIIKHKRKPKTIDDLFNDLKSKNITVSELIEKAKHMASNGQPREAMHFYLAAIIFVLNEKNIIKYAPYKTNNRLLREIMFKNQQIGDLFGLLINDFNSAWYGHKDVTDFSKWQATFDQLFLTLNNYEEAVLQH